MKISSFLFLLAFSCSWKFSLGSPSLSKLISNIKENKSSLILAVGLFSKEDRQIVRWDPELKPCAREEDKHQILMGWIMNQGLSSRHLHDKNNTLCHHLNARYSGTDLKDSVVDEDFAENATNCQAQCRSHPNCKFYLFFTNKHHQRFKHKICRLLQYSGRLEHNLVGHISGPKHCVSPHILKRINSICSALNSMKTPSTEAPVSCHPSELDGDIGTLFPDLGSNFTSILRDTILEVHCSNTISLSEQEYDVIRVQSLLHETNFEIQPATVLRDGFLIRTDDEEGTTTLPTVTKGYTLRDSSQDSMTKLEEPIDPLTTINPGESNLLVDTKVPYNDKSMGNFDNENDNTASDNPIESVSPPTNDDYLYYDYYGYDESAQKSTSDSTKQTPMSSIDTTEGTEPKKSTSSESNMISDSKPALSQIPFIKETNDAFDLPQILRINPSTESLEDMNMNPRADTITLNLKEELKNKAPQDSNMKPSSELSTKPSSESNMEPSSESSLKLSSDSKLNPSSESNIKPSLLSNTKTSSESNMESSSESSLKPSSASSLNPFSESNMKPSLLSNTKSSSESNMGPSFESSMKPSFESSMKPSSESNIKPLSVSNMKPLPSESNSLEDEKTRSGTEINAKLDETMIQDSSMSTNLDSSDTMENAFQINPSLSTKFEIKSSSSETPTTTAKLVDFADNFQESDYKFSQSTNTDAAENIMDVTQGIKNTFGPDTPPLIEKMMSNNIKSESNQNIPLTPSTPTSERVPRTDSIENTVKPKGSIPPPNKSVEEKHSNLSKNPKNKADMDQQDDKMNKDTSERKDDNSLLSFADSEKNDNSFLITEETMMMQPTAEMDPSIQIRSSLGSTQNNNEKKGKSRAGASMDSKTGSLSQKSPQKMMNNDLRENNGKGSSSPKSLEAFTSGPDKIIFPSEEMSTNSNEIKPRNQPAKILSLNPNDLPLFMKLLRDHISQGEIRASKKMMSTTPSQTLATQATTPRPPQRRIYIYPKIIQLHNNDYEPRALWLRFYSRKT